MTTAARASLDHPGLLPERAARPATRRQGWLGSGRSTRSADRPRLVRRCGLRRAVRARRSRPLHRRERGASRGHATRDQRARHRVRGGRCGCDLVPASLASRGRACGVGADRRCLHRLPSPPRSPSSRVVVHRPVRIAVPITVAYLVTTIAYALVYPDSSTDWWVQTIWAVVFTSAIFAWGMFVRARRQLVHSLRDRVHQAETEQR